LFEVVQMGVGWLIASVAGRNRWRDVRWPASFVVSERLAMGSTEEHAAKDNVVCIMSILSRDGGERRERGERESDAERRGRVIR
jgi:steroid 5-alpha reductase family enzyme